MRKLIALAGAVVVSLGLIAPATAGTGASAVFPPDAAPDGMTYPEWQGAYAIWLNEIPRRENPLLHPDSPRNCEVIDGVVYAGAFGANCDVPSYAPVVFGTMSWECSTAEGMGGSFWKLRKVCSENFDRDLGPSVMTQRILIDGARLDDDRSWVFLSPGEIIDFPEHNVWNAEPGPSKSVTKGFLFILRPMTSGDHKVRVRVHHEYLGNFRVVWTFHVS